MKSNSVAIYPGKGAQRYQQYSACTTCLPANFIISKCQFKTPVAPSPCPLTKEKRPSQNHVSVSLFPVTTERHRTKNASSQHRVHPFFPWRRIPLSRIQGVARLFIILPLHRKIQHQAESTRAHSEHLQFPQQENNCLSWIFPTSAAGFSLSFCLSPLLRRPREMSPCPVHHV